MDIILHFFDSLRSLDSLILWGGYAVLFIIIFAETGLLVGFFLPGDTLLIAAGLVAARGQMNLLFIDLVMIFAAVLGDTMGYVIGKKLGLPLFQKPDSVVFRREYLLKTKNFYDKHGRKTVFLGRFVPIVRTFAGVVAGVTEMSFGVFLLCSVAGAVVWIVAFTLMGYIVGSRFPQMDRFINLAILFFLLVAKCIFLYQVIKRKFFPPNIQPNA
jgi:membrane-associated protein